MQMKPSAADSLVGHKPQEGNMRVAWIKKIMILVLSVLVVLSAAVCSHAASFRFVMENNGATWKLGNNHYLGSIGFKDLQATSVFTVADINAHIDQGMTVSFYAGKGLKGYNEFSPLAPDTVFDYTSIAGEQAVDNAFYVEFATDKIRFAHFGFEGHKHLHGNIDLGSLESVPAPTPAPSAGLLLAIGIAVTVCGALYYENRH
ncbi:hypothetical protein [Maridesulfovibrio sp.]|uniref:hypothetical protein n=1 Tax=Maridesulfovibrio sp. TaxID=2795000 RepID=UPI002A18D619|nr:hypothetical protein [Maridesulfovibrio sp.]